MHKTPAETIAFVEALKKLLPQNNPVEIIIAPPFTSLESAAKAVKDTPYLLAAQNMHWETSGAFTGEISAAMLKAVGCTAVLIGHSERRRLFGETDEQIHKKMKAALSEGLRAIFCVGETLQEREARKMPLVLEKQLTAGLKGLSGGRLSHVIIAYEPVWAIGTGKVATAQEAEAAQKHIRKIIWDHFGMASASHIPILYGGSVKPDNFSEIAAQPNVDGALVGGASLDPKSFIEILGQMK